ncbi:hypothetical protein CsSME_00044592 [Camellia sinensis var. sinensis]
MAKQIDCMIIVWVSAISASCFRIWSLSYSLPPSRESNMRHTLRISHELIDSSLVTCQDDTQTNAAMTNQELIDNGNQMMDETDQAIERSKKVVHDTINVGTDTAAALKAQTEQMSRIVNELDSIHFSIKKASKLVKEIGRQVATDKCIMALLFLIVLGVVTIIIVKLVNPHNKDIRDIPGLAPPVQSRRLLWKC